MENKLPHSTWHRSRTRQESYTLAPSFLSPSKVGFRAWNVTIIYAIFASLWIYFSDRALSAIAPDAETLLTWSVYKGFAFVVITSSLLFLLVHRALAAVETNFQQVQRHEYEIERLNRLYAALSQINQAIAWSTNREELFKKVCQVLSVQGGFPMSWIGWYDPETERLNPVAVWGDDNNYLQSIRVYASDRPEGRGPSGRAFREGVPYICNSLATDPVAQPWREEAQRRGFRASVAMPIRMKGKVCATLSVYAREENYFQDKEMALLTEAATDISFSLDNLAREEEKLEAEASLLREKAFSDTMIESMPGILYFYDAEGRFLRWNKNFEQVSGYSGEEIARMHPLDFFETEVKPLVESRIQEVFSKGDSSIEAPLRSKNGTTAPYFFTGRKILTGGRVCLVGVGIDISEQKQAEQDLKRSEQRYRSTLDSVLEGCQIIAFDWSSLYINHAAEVQNRRPRSEMLGNKMTDLFPGLETTEVFALFQRSMNERVALRAETEFTFPDGTKRWFDVRVEPDPEGIIVFSIDITERHTVEKTLREANEMLEQKVIERTNELQKALIRAEASDHLKSAFLATMSHELRTPLNSILGFTGIILQGLAGPLNEEQTRQLGMVRGSARHLLELINDVLDLSKIEAGQLSVQSERFSLPDSVAKVIDLVRPMAQQKNLNITLQMSPLLGEMISDRRRVEQILLNLLSNAVKFTNAGGICLTAEPLQDAEAPPSVLLKVADTGIGIESAQMDKLFQPFQQIDSGLTRRHDGTGLGLAISQRLAHLLSGTMHVSSVWGKGSEFSAILPLNLPHKP